MPIPRTFNHAFFKTWSREMAYVLGYFAADGSMIKNKRGGHYIEFVSTDRCLLESLQRVTGSRHHISERDYGGNSKTAFRVQIGSKEWFQSLLKLGFAPNKSNNLVFPDVSHSCLGHFVRGYFDGDGCVYFNQLRFADRTNKRWIVQSLFTSGSRSFLVLLHKRLKERGINGGSLKQKHNKRGFELVFSHRDSLALYQLMYHTGPVSDLFLPRKRGKLEQAIKTLNLRP